ncbi:transposase [Roseomonas marmotae]|uniref:Transposase n=1 Tax=Roseomonas marmotae TaxID=2768161 RepID=A0ABS3KD91_9PROT|nr:transposase [Roseomonas marmotae]MBO1075436.1 transposase [Roseomonas marmotae]QTI81389.1 transposase [Roseomonas marmotae]
MAPFRPVLARQADRLVIDDTALPRKGTTSVGVAPQYCDRPGRPVDRQSPVLFILAQGKVPAPVASGCFYWHYSCGFG